MTGAWILIVVSTGLSAPSFEVHPGLTEAQCRRVVAVASAALDRGRISFTCFGPQGEMIEATKDDR